MYDAKKLPENDMEKHFNESLDSINGSLKYIDNVNEFDGYIIKESIQKIIDRANSLTSGEATEMLEGLGQVMNILSARINEVEILTDIVANPDYVSKVALAKIITSSLLGSSCNLAEVFTPLVPEHLLPEG